MELGAPAAQSGRRLLRNIPWALLLVVAAIAALGVWNLASAARGTHAAVWKSQTWWLLMGLGACLAIAAVDYRHLLHLAYPIYGGIVLLLLAVALKGKSAMGAQRWLDLGPMHLQPSELMKLGILLVVARFFHVENRHREGYSLHELWQPLLLLAVPVVLVMRQPDLGTSLMIATMAASLILFAKVKWQTLALFTVGGLAGAVGAWTWLLKTYQKKRVLTFLDPEGDLLGAGYHASQSLIALGSGQEFGKGWGQGTQTQLSFLPEQHTDFVFSVWGEEQGFVGAALLLGLYLAFLLLALQVAAGARERFGAFLAVGVAALFFWHVLVNMGMVTGLLPVVGVTLPLMSYGGSSVLTNLVALGLLLSVALRRPAA